MYTGKLAFVQVMEHLPWHHFHGCVKRYNGDHKVKSFPCTDQYQCLAFTQLTYRASFRDIEVRPRAQAVYRSTTVLDQLRSSS